MMETLHSTLSGQPAAAEFNREDGCGSEVKTASTHDADISIVQKSLQRLDTRSENCSPAWCHKSIISKYRAHNLILENERK